MLLVDEPALQQKRVLVPIGSPLDSHLLLHFQMSPQESVSWHLPFFLPPSAKRRTDVTRCHDTLLANGGEIFLPSQEGQGINLI